MEFTKEQIKQMRMIEYIDECHEHVLYGGELSDRQISNLEKYLDELDPIIISEELGDCYEYWADMCEEILCSL